MDITSPHLFYVIAAYGLAVCVFSFLTYWVVKEDRKASQQLSKWLSDDT